MSALKTRSIAIIFLVTITLFFRGVYTTEAAEPFTRSR